MTLQRSIIKVNLQLPEGRCTIGANMSPKNPEPFRRGKDRAVWQLDRLAWIDRAIERCCRRIGEQAVMERIRHARAVIGFGQNGNARSAPPARSLGLGQPDIDQGLGAIAHGRSVSTQ